ncbi:23S rRNA (adenine(2503)-C(2))-methyltransferase RlmN [Granulicella sibirica]|uniref:Probable dual-specificity RNA methyltransferase RlmN n=1 Tax=Granulicella sibirica TaxID=2479048 RepID=A0A4Q0T5B8_9BACT|nr:23S rRNA (adenine(2503)-C(2))-methyltransferase RlmN [Granulicella sibirica]RXH56761.1 Ribosomal RNA large subunit methyltransferase N [Granulicella sibirica]
MQVTTNSSPVKSRALFGWILEDLAELMRSLDQPAYRAAQLHDALYRQRIASLDQITTLPVAIRERLIAEGYSVGLPEIAQTARSIDGTERYLIRLADGETVETVWMPGGDGGERGDGTPAAAEEENETPATVADDYKRATICISSQVGCAVNCQFCLTARLGIRRNLTAGEIAGQLAIVLNRHNVEVGRDRINLVFMGMGEPFLNYANFMDSVRLLTGAMRIPESRMTVSTSGIIPSIELFANETVRPKLAVSLNASNDEVRESIMPITRKWNIENLLAAVAKVPLRTKERVTFEYVLLKGLNDQLTHARELVRLVGQMRAKINLIVWNPGPDMPFDQPADNDVAAFQKHLRDNNIPAYIRRPRGRDIYAACGQLKRTVEAAPLVSIAI